MAAIPPMCAEDNRKAMPGIAFRADHVGSLLRPKKLREAFRKLSLGEIPERELHSVQDE
jgi:5-methyltetrahydropteroyltriglutamate--homocysteine methyltransferase